MAFRIWLHSWLLLNAGIAIYYFFSVGFSVIPAIIITLVVSFIGGIPAFVIYALVFPSINHAGRSPVNRIKQLLLISFGIALLYGLVPAICLNEPASFEHPERFFYILLICSGSLIASSFAAIGINRNRLLYAYFKPCVNPISANNENIDKPKTTNMNPLQETNPEIVANSSKPGHNALVKGIITGGLILLMLIPTVFISSLVNERQLRQQEVVNDVSSKWSSAQTFTGPYLSIPYYRKEKDVTGNEKVYTEQLLVLPENLEVNGAITPEARLRSIYKVLLYKTTINSKGNFLFQLPKDVDPASLALTDAKVCMGISDFKGIEKKIDITINGTTYSLSPGLPSDMIDSTGLSAPISLTKEDISKPISFFMPLQLKGSEQLHFLPLAGNSQFTIHSTWPNPSFDGNTIPGERDITEKGFAAKWVYNKANLPFGTVLKTADNKINRRAFAFGVSMLQPADQYAKTSRSVKYAILFIGLTFALFYIIELMQQKPVHPVQYVLIGLALVVFYTLLLSISEFLLFDSAYLIASIATLSLITLYAKSHFKAWKIAGIFASLIGSLYAFIFVLIRLEDTALLVGSIGLFIVLALVMYTSRKINWYQPSAEQPLTA